MKPHYRAVILVLASDNLSLYEYFKRAHEVYMPLMDPRVKVFFTYGRSIKFEPKEHDLVFPYLKETLGAPECTTKTTDALERIVDVCTFDYLVRTNISTFWHVERLLARLDTLPSTQMITGRQGVFPPLFVTGTGMIVSKDLVFELIKRKSEVNVVNERYVAEDRRLSMFFTDKLGAQCIVNNKAIFVMERLLSADLNGIDEMLDLFFAGEYDHIRVKNFKGDRDVIDRAVTQRICKRLYNIDLE